MSYILSIILFVSLLFNSSIMYSRSTIDEKYYLKGAIDLMKMQFECFPQNIKNLNGAVSLSDSINISLILPIFRLKTNVKKDSLIRMIDFTPNNLNQELYILKEGRVFYLNSELGFFYDDINSKPINFPRLVLTDFDLSRDYFFSLKEYKEKHPYSMLFILDVPDLYSLWAINDDKIIYLNVVVNQDSFSKNISFSFEERDGNDYFFNYIYRKLNIIVGGK